MIWTFHSKRKWINSSTRNSSPERFLETQNRSSCLLTQFRTESRFLLFLELLWRGDIQMVGVGLIGTGFMGKCH
ncbi:MAG: hypothetical protein E5V44_15440, partial [Mesorhizobium sp.]